MSGDESDAPAPESAWPERLGAQRVAEALESALWTNATLAPPPAQTHTPPPPAQSLVNPSPAHTPAPSLAVAQPQPQLQNPHALVAALLGDTGTGTAEGEDEESDEDSMAAILRCVQRARQRGPTDAPCDRRRDEAAQLAMRLLETLGIEDSDSDDERG